MEKCVLFYLFLKTGSWSFSKETFSICIKNDHLLIFPVSEMQFSSDQTEYCCMHVFTMTQKVVPRLPALPSFPFSFVLPEEPEKMSGSVSYMCSIPSFLAYWLHNWKARQQDQWDPTGLWGSHQNCQRHWWLSCPPSHHHGFAGQYQHRPVPHQRQVSRSGGRRAHECSMRAD